MVIKLRPADASDMELLYKWANDQEVRANSFSQHDISFAEHEQWFNRKLSSPDCKIFIACEKGLPGGQIRIDINNRTGYISYSVARDQRGRGIGTAMLLQVIALAKDGVLNVAELIGKVKPGNKASGQAFLKAGFIKMKQDEHQVYTYKL